MARVGGVCVRCGNISGWGAHSLGSNSGLVERNGKVYDVPIDLSKVGLGLLHSEAHSTGGNAGS